MLFIIELVYLLKFKNFPASLINLLSFVYLLLFRDVMRQLDLDEWRGVLLISGDALLHEVYNGLFVR